jgi:hypothetical protein
LGLVYVALGESQRAIEMYEQQLSIARGFGDRRGEANASWNLGLALEKEGVAPPRHRSALSAQATRSSSPLLRRWVVKGLTSSRSTRSTALSKRSANGV